MKRLADGLLSFVIMIFALCAAGGCLISCSGTKESRLITASGTIETREVNVASRVNGQILKIDVEEGMRVQSGEALVLIDHDLLDIQLRQAEAGLALAQAQLDLLRKGARAEDIRQAEEALRQADTHLKIAADDAKRMKELLDKGSVPVKQKDDAEARHTVAEAQQIQAREALAKVKQLARPEEIRAAEARLAQAQASVDLLRKSIADCVIVSPVNGVVMRRPVEVGELIAAGATVMTVAELDQVHVMIYVTEKELGRVRLGQEAAVSIDSAPGRIFQGRVVHISSEAEFTPKNIQTREDRVKLVFGVKIEIANPEGILKPGLPADALLRTEGTIVR